MNVSNLYIIEEGDGAPGNWIFVDLTLLLMNKHNVASFEICTALYVNCIDGIRNYLSDEGLVQVTSEGIIERLREMSSPITNDTGVISTQIAGVKVDFQILVKPDSTVVINKN